MQRRPLLPGWSGGRCCSSGSFAGRHCEPRRGGRCVAERPRNVFRRRVHPARTRLRMSNWRAAEKRGTSAARPGKPRGAPSQNKSRVSLDDPAFSDPGDVGPAFDFFDHGRGVKDLRHRGSATGVNLLMPRGDLVIEMGRFRGDCSNRRNNQQHFQCVILLEIGESRKRGFFEFGAERSPPPQTKTPPCGGARLN